MSSESGLCLQTTHCSCYGNDALYNTSQLLHFTWCSWLVQNLAFGHQACRYVIVGINRLLEKQCCTAQVLSNRGLCAEQRHQTGFEHPSLAICKRCCHGLPCPCSCTSNFKRVVEDETRIAKIQELAFKPLKEGNEWMKQIFKYSLRPSWMLTVSMVL